MMLAQGKRPQAYHEAVDGEGMHGAGLRPPADLRVQGQQEAGLLRQTPVNEAVWGYNS